MFGLKERPYPGRVLISFWCDNKNFLIIKTFYVFTFLRIFLRFSILAVISILLILEIMKIW